MKKFLNLAILIALVPVLMLSSCKKDEEEDPQVNKFEVLTDYMKSNNLDLNNVLDSWIIDANAVNAARSLEDYYFIDIRKEADYNAGHINGAVNSPLNGVLNAAANAGGKPIIVVCYTGQTAGHAVCALRLSGYADAKVLKWGMSGWNTQFSGPWNGNVGGTAGDHTNWATAPGEIAASVDYNKFPTINSSYDDGVNILNERVAALLANGFNTVTNANVFDDPALYCINNYWAEADVTEYGNIKSAYRIQPLTLSGNEIKYLDPDKPVVTYCWTGQTSSMITAYLWVIGYDAKSLVFGANGMIYDDLHSHKWSEPTTNYDYITTK